MIVKNVSCVSLIISNLRVGSLFAKKTKKTCTKQVGLERAMRIELTTKAWEAFVLPLNYARGYYALIVSLKKNLSNKSDKFCVADTCVLSMIIL